MTPGAVVPDAVTLDVTIRWAAIVGASPDGTTVTPGAVCISGTGSCASTWSGSLNTGNADAIPSTGPVDSLTSPVSSVLPPDGDPSSARPAAGSTRGNPSPSRGGADRGRASTRATTGRSTDTEVPETGTDPRCADSTDRCTTLGGSTLGGSTLLAAPARGSTVRSTRDSPTIGKPGSANVSVGAMARSTCTDSGTPSTGAGDTGSGDADPFGTGSAEADPSAIGSAGAGSTAICSAATCSAVASSTSGVGICAETGIGVGIGAAVVGAVAGGLSEASRRCTTEPRGLRVGEWARGIATDGSAGLGTTGRARPSIRPDGSSDATRCASGSR